MNIRIGYIPYLNMVPFQQGFGPEPVELQERRFEFRTLSPRALGQQAEQGVIDAGALSLVDFLKVSPHYQRLGTYGIGVKRDANSVLFFSNRRLQEFSGTVAVTEETSTSFRLLQLILEVRYGLQNVRYGRIASSAMYDGLADGVLLIGDEALRAREEGIRGLHVMTDLGRAWYEWHKVPFAFAVWAAREGLRQDVKDLIENQIEKSMLSTEYNHFEIASRESEKRGLSPDYISAYWHGFNYRLGPEHLESIRIFQDLLVSQCLTV